MTVKKCLAVFSRNVGLRSETFIRRHMHDLAPGRTVAISQNASRVNDSMWVANCPTLVAEQPPELFQRIPGVFRKWLPARWDGLKDRKAVEKFLSDHDVSVLLGEYLHDSWPLIPVAREMGLRFFAHAHGYDLSMLFRSGLWRSRYSDYSSATGMIVVNRVMRDRLLSVGIPKEKIHIIACGVDVPDAPLIRKDHQVLKCLAVGRMVAKKAPLNMLEAFYKAVSVNPDIRLDVVGTGPLYSAVRDFVSSKNLTDKITIHGGRSNDFVMQLMHKADCFIQHSIVDPETGDEEGLPVAILEAMSATLPVLATRHAGIPEAVLHGSTGLLVEEGDIRGMTENILELSDNGPRRRAMGEAGWARALERFSWEMEKERLQNLLEL